MNRCSFLWSPGKNEGGKYLQQNRTDAEHVLRNTHAEHTHAAEEDSSIEIRPQLDPRICISW